jgi:hypothetical protein
VKLFNRRPLLSELRKLADLEANWDGYQADPIDPDILKAAERIAETMPLFAGLPSVVPMTRGRLQFEWHKGSRSLEIEVEDPETIHWLKFDTEGIEEEATASSYDTQAIYDLLNWFISS